MSEKVKSKKQRVIYYSLLAVMLVLIGVITVIAVTGGKKNGTDVGSKEPDKVSDSQSSSEKPDVSSSTPPEDNPHTPDDTPNTPVVEVITFIIPVEGGACTKEYTDNTVVYSSTLGVYTGHMGMDFSAAENAKVVAVYKGTVKSITTGYLQGTTVTIDHGNGLLTVYNSIEPSETLKVGDKVEAGTVLGTVSSNNKQEYKDGPHLHFEVYENNTVISPLKYLTVEEK